MTKPALRACFSACASSIDAGVLPRAPTSKASFAQGVDHNGLKRRVFGTRFLAGSGASGGRRRFRGGPVVVVRFQYNRAISVSSFDTALEGFTAGAVVPVDLDFLSQPFTTSVCASSPISSLEKTF